MTIREKLEAMLVEHGLFRNQARAIIDMVARDKHVRKEMAERWNDSVSDYPPMFINVLWLHVRNHTLAWIDQNCPNAWYRSLFEND